MIEITMNLVTFTKILVRPVKRALKMFYRTRKSQKVDT